MTEVLQEALCRIRSETCPADDSQWDHGWDKTWPKDWSKTWHRDGSTWNRNWPKQWNRSDGRS